MHTYSCYRTSDGSFIGNVDNCNDEFEARVIARIRFGCYDCFAYKINDDDFDDDEEYDDYYDDEEYNYYDDPIDF